MSCIDFDSGIRRAGGSRALYWRFLKQFPEDSSMRELCLALACGDSERAFLCAHTLKGLCAQLSITVLCPQADALCELLRPRDPALLDAARAKCSELIPMYERVVREIMAL